MRIFIAVLDILLFVLAPYFLGNKVYAQSSSDKYVWEYLSPRAIQSSSNDLKSLLEDHVSKVIAAGHLAPFRTLYGERYTHYSWYHNFDTIYTLSLAYPYVNETLQGSIKTYVKNEMQTYPLWNSAYLSATTGAKRQADDITTTEIGGIPGDYSSRPKLFALYALWLYANNTGDWAYIETNWTNIKNFYNGNRGEAANYYTSIAGAIGMARMAKQKTTPDTATQSTAISDITNGLTQGKNFTLFGQKATSAYQFIGDNDFNYTFDNTYQGFQFIDITPEIGRYMFDDSSLKTSVLGSSTSDIYSLKRGEYFWPMWYMAQSPSWTVFYGEGSGIPVEAKSMLFPIHVWVLKEPNSTLRKYIDVPDALLGDYYYMQNLTRTIESNGTQCWENIQTTTEECSGSIYISGTPTAGKPGDANNDGKVDGIDYIIWLNHYNQNVSGPSNGDFNSDGKVDGIDYIWWLNNYGK